MIYYYYRFITSLAQIVIPLYILLPKTLKQTSVEFYKCENESFQQVKNELAKSTLLVFPKNYTPINITVDASDLAIGMSIEQLINNLWEPLAIFSKKLSDPLKKYSTYGSELLSIYSAI